MKGLYDSIINLGRLPFHLISGMVSKDFAENGKMLISLSPDINSVNDCTGFYSRRFSFNRYGYWGYSPAYDGGTNYGAMYAFLPNYFTWKLGVTGYTLLSILIYLLLFALLSVYSPMPYPWLVILVGGAALYSPYFKNSVFVCSRHDIPGWGLLFIGLWALCHGLNYVSIIPLTLAFMTHPSISVAGGCFFIVFWFLSDSFSLHWFPIFVLAQVLNLFWYVPFIKIFWSRMIVLHSWSHKESDTTDKTRTIAIHGKKAFGMAIFILCLLISEPDRNVILFALVPFLIFLVSYWQERFINRFAIELMWLCGAGSAYANSAEPWLGIPYLFSLYLYASPAPRYGFPFKPLLISRNHFDRSFAPILKSLPENVRLGLFFPFDSMEQYRSDAKYIFILNTWLQSLNSRVEFINVHHGFSDDLELTHFCRDHGISHILTSDDYRQFFNDSSILNYVASGTTPSLGTVKGTGIHLYECPKDHTRIVPEGRVAAHHRNGLNINCDAGRHELRYRPVPGLKILQAGKELKIQDKQAYRFFFSSKGKDEIRIVFSLARLWYDFMMLDLGFKKLSPKRFHSK